MEDTSSGSKIVVAVDFGTAYSSVAWASASNASISTERHRVINQWPQGPSTSFGGMTSEKVPTEVAYEYGKSGTTCLWGFQIYDCMPHIQWIKLGFAGDRKFGLASRLSFNYHDRRRVPEPYHSSNEDVATDYLRCLYKHIIESLKSKIGSSFDGMSLEFVLNVPAMWPDKAKMTTLRYTEHAGFGENGTIRLISEPEAAAMHALNVANPHGLNVGDTVVLCDVGGGAPGDGSLCGSTYLNRRFEKFLESQLSSIPGWGHGALDKAMQRFENVIKRTFCGDVTQDSMIPVPGIADDSAIHVHRGRLRVNGQELADLFKPILEEILYLVDNQVKTSKKRYLRDALPQDMEVLTPVDGWTAVVRAALLKSLGEISPLATRASVESRVARKHYGLVYSEKYERNIHDRNKRGTSYVAAGTFDSIRVTMYELDTPVEEKPPLYFNRHIKKHAKLNTGLDAIEKARIPVRAGYDNEEYYQIDYEIHATYFSAHCE
ncbi:hypothetical protein BDV26DRAFT_286274 [Aspergillus bertholletiae]|uniref:Actin-like ATPase domain-containing protein n=1 Tax=Aspergillus bertholletiae TaxID=1226010 RepID=A0A5N7ATF3_9EURO|nr:hypothetical protein BDV26DRAFT_286274 [Aspergillus bertholletiae]